MCVHRVLSLAALVVSTVSTSKRISEGGLGSGGGMRPQQSRPSRARRDAVATWSWLSVRPGCPENGKECAWSEMDAVPRLLECSPWRNASWSGMPEARASSASDCSKVLASLGDVAHLGREMAGKQVGAGERPCGMQTLLLRSLPRHGSMLPRSGTLPMPGPTLPTHTHTHATPPHPHPTHTSPPPQPLPAAHHEARHLAVVHVDGGAAVVPQDRPHRLNLHHHALRPGGQQACHTQQRAGRS